jgi:hypothetical protein
VSSGVYQNRHLLEPEHGSEWRLWQLAWGILDIFRLYGVRAGQILMRNYVLTEFLRYSDVRMRDFIAGLQYADERDWIIAPIPNVLRLTEEGMRSYMQLL